MSGEGDRGLLLREALARARRGAFYAEHLRGHEITDAADLRRLPLTRKSHLRDATPFGMLAVPPAKAWHYHETSGTTGEPISTWCGLAELRQMAAIVARQVPELARDGMLLNRFPLFAPVAFVFEEALRQAGACHIAAGTMSWDVPFDRALDFIRRLGVTAISSLPLEPILLHDLCVEQGRDPRQDLASVQVVFSGGAVLPPSLKRIIEQDWQARVVEIYGSNETMMLGLGCTAGRLHLATELIEPEILDPVSLEPSAAGVPGILTVTSLVHETMPLVRYFTGDLVRRVPGDCPCGLATPVIEVLGRWEDRLQISGREATAWDVLDAAYEFADRFGKRIFFVVVLPHRLHLLIEVEHPGAPPAGAVAAEARLAERIGVPVQVEYLAHNEVMDRTALHRGPKIYKPSVISDWRGSGRRTITVMEALLEWPTYDRRTVFHLLKRQVKNARRRSRLLKEIRRTSA